MLKTFRQKQKMEKGQAFLELAVSVLFLLILLSAVIDLGWALYEMIAMRDAAQEGATYGAICQFYGDGTAGYYYPTVMERITKSATAPLDIAKTKVEIDFYDPTDVKIGSSDLFFTKTRDPDYGDKVRITIKYNHQIVTPFVGTFIGNQWNYPLEINVSDSVLRKLINNC